MRKIMTIWFVVDLHETQLSWSTKNDSAEQFKSFRTAQRRAAELSQLEPGKSFAICQATHICSAAVGPSVTARIGG